VPPAGRSPLGDLDPLAVPTDLGRHLDGHGFAAARELIEQKKRGERTDLP
jgi:hypothetical protein